jgi:hypothetical protein
VAQSALSVRDLVHPIRVVIEDTPKASPGKQNVVPDLVTTRGDFRSTSYAHLQPRPLFLRRLRHRPVHGFKMIGDAMKMDGAHAHAAQLAELLKAVLKRVAILAALAPAYVN